jgi:hypothetical protein
MGLFGDGPFESVKSCDYSLGIAELYMRVTLDLVRENRGLLPLVGRRGEPRTTEGLPSWALDWVQPHEKEMRTHDYFANCRRWEFFNCAGGMYVDPIITDANGLVLQGLRVDYIATLASVQFVDHKGVTEEDYDDKAREIARSFRSVFDAWLETQGPDPVYIGGSADSPLDAFRRTLIGDLMLDVEGYEDHRASYEEAECVDAQIAGEQTIVHHSLRDMVCSQSFFITKAGFIGIGPPDARLGDEVWVLYCGNFPHLLRPLGSGEHGGKDSDQKGFEHVGDVYVHGIMDGERVVHDGESGPEVILY